MEKINTKLMIFSWIYYYLFNFIFSPGRKKPWKMMTMCTPNRAHIYRGGVSAIQNENGNGLFIFVARACWFDWNDNKLFVCVCVCVFMGNSKQPDKSQFAYFANK